MLEINGVEWFLFAHWSLANGIAVLWQPSGAREKNSRNLGPVQDFTLGGRANGKTNKTKQLSQAPGLNF